MVEHHFSTRCLKTQEKVVVQAGIYSLVLFVRPTNFHNTISFEDTYNPTRINFLETTVNMADIGTSVTYQHQNPKSTVSVLHVTSCTRRPVIKNVAECHCLQSGSETQWKPKTGLVGLSKLKDLEYTNLGLAGDYPLDIPNLKSLGNYITNHHYILEASLSYTFLLTYKYIYIYI